MGDEINAIYDILVAMIGPYWMAFINAVLFTVLLCGFLLFKHKFPKKKINYLALLIVTALLPCISIFRTGVYESGDFVYHIYRAMSFYDALKDGVLIPSWAGNLNSGYGYPVFIFIYNIPYYIFATFHSVGFTFIYSERLLLALSFISSGLFMYALLRKITKNNLAAFAGAIVYLYTPYHLVDLHFRVSIAEVIAFTIAPLIFYLILKIEENKKINYILWLGLLFGIFFLDHPAQFIFYSGIFFAYILYQIIFLKKKIFKVFLCVSLSFLIGMIISSYAWLARFTLSQFTYSSTLIHIPVTYVRPLELLFSPWRFGLLFQGSQGELSFAIGYTQIAIIILSAYFIWRYKFSSPVVKQLLFWFFVSIAIIFLMLPYSKLIWDLFPLLNLMQFSYRLLHPLIFCISILTAYLVLHYKTKKKIIFIFLILTIGYTLLNWGNRGMIPSINDQWIANNLIYSTPKGEAMVEGRTIWWKSKTEPWITQIAENHLEFIKGDGQIKEISRTSVNHTYTVYASTPSALLENTFYFPDWTIRVDSRPVKINYTSSAYPARMVFNIPKGLHYVQIQYSDIPIIKTAKLLSITSILIIFFYTLIALTRYIKGKIYS